MMIKNALCAKFPSPPATLARLALLACLTCILVSCAPPVHRAAPPEKILTQAQANAIAAWIPPERLAHALLRAVTNSPVAEAEMLAALDRAAIECLDNDSTAELRRKLATLARGSNQHPFTSNQLATALSRK